VVWLGGSAYHIPIMMMLEGPGGPITSLAFSSDSEFLAAGGTHGSVRIWDAGGGLIRSFQTALSGHRIALGFDLKDRYLAIAAKSHLFLGSLTEDPGWDTALRIPGHAVSVSFVTQDLLAVATGRGAETTSGGYVLYDVAKRSPRLPLQTEQHGVRALVTYPREKRLAWCTGNNLLRWCNIAVPGVSEARLGQPGNDVAFDPEGKQIAVGIDWKIRLFQSSTKLERGQLTGHKGVVTSVVFHPREPLIISGSWDETIKLWNLGSMREEVTLIWGIGKIHKLAVAPDGSRFAAGSDRGQILVWDAE
jgi:WD40 repeat protein